MATEKPLDLEHFFITRNELATKHNSKLELQAMARIRAHLVEDMEAKAKAKAKADTSKGKDNKKD